MLVRLQPDIVKLDKELVQALPGRVARDLGQGWLFGRPERPAGHDSRVGAVRRASSARAAAAVAVDPSRPDSAVALALSPALQR